MWTESPICLSIVSVVPRQLKRKDVDNLVKGLLDAMEGVLYPNDGAVQCMTSRRMDYSGPAGHYIVSARSVLPWLADVVFDDPTPARIVSAERVTEW
jgi:hypothetical protein